MDSLKKLRINRFKTILALPPGNKIAWPIKCKNPFVTTYVTMTRVLGGVKLETMDPTDASLLIIVEYIVNEFGKIINTTKVKKRFGF